MLVTLSSSIDMFTSALRLIDLLCMSSIWHFCSVSIHFRLPASTFAGRASPLTALDVRFPWFPFSLECDDLAILSCCSWLVGTYCYPYACCAELPCGP